MNANQRSWDAGRVQGAELIFWPDLVISGPGHGLELGVLCGPIRRNDSILKNRHSVYTQYCYSI